MRRQNYVKERVRLLLTFCLLVTEFRFDAILCSKLGNENSDAGHIKCSRGPQVPHPWTGATKSQQSQIFSAVSKVYETSTNHISRSYHEGIPSYYVKKSQNLSFGQNFLAAQFFLFTEILLKLQEQIVICFCKFSCNSVIIMGLLRFFMW